MSLEKLSEAGQVTKVRCDPKMQSICPAPNWKHVQIQVLFLYKIGIFPTTDEENTYIHVHSSWSCHFESPVPRTFFKAT